MQRCLIILTVAWLGVAGSAAAQSAPATGDQRRQYLFAPTGQEMPYRIYVPTAWDGKRSLPILLFLHGAGANESTYLDMAGGLLGQLAEKHGYIVVSPLGFAPLGASAIRCGYPPCSASRARRPRSAPPSRPNADASSP